VAVRLTRYTLDGYGFGKRTGPVRRSQGRNGRKTASVVKSFENLSLQHNSGTIDYEQIPPVGGEHNPLWQNAGFYEQQVLEEQAVHTLEHGAVWITYRADLPEDQKEELRRIVESQDCLLASPYPSLPSPVVASAWGKQLRLKSVDDPKLQEFILAYRKGPQTPEPGAPCTGGAVR
jgi:hypothetical protein